MTPHADGASPSMGIELPHVYDGISVWQMPDGSLVNRWDLPLANALAEGRHLDVPILRRRRDLTDQWIAKRDRSEAW